MEDNGGWVRDGVGARATLGVVAYVVVLKE